jgi:divalent metal cation (Fe/Co/Zn/Cd) transporter
MLETLKITLYCVVALTLILNLMTVFKETRELKAQGKTPLTFRNIVTLFLAAAGEALVIFGLLALLFSGFDIAVTQFSMGVTFVIAYIARNVGAYLFAWLTWEVFVRIDRRKLKNQIEEDQEAAL